MRAAKDGGGSGRTGHVGGGGNVRRASDSRGVGWAGGAARGGGATVTASVVPSHLGSRCASSIRSTSPSSLLCPTTTTTTTSNDRRAPCPQNDRTERAGNRAPAHAAPRLLAESNDARTSPPPQLPFAATDDPPPFFSSLAPFTTARSADPPGRRLAILQRPSSLPTVRLQKTAPERDTHGSGVSMGHAGFQNARRRAGRVTPGRQGAALTPCRRREGGGIHLSNNSYSFR